MRRLREVKRGLVILAVCGGTQELQADQGMLSSFAVDVQCLYSCRSATSQHSRQLRKTQRSVFDPVSYGLLRGNNRLWGFLSSALWTWGAGVCQETASQACGSDAVKSYVLEGLSSGSWFLLHRPECSRNPPKEDQLSPYDSSVMLKVPSLAEFTARGSLSSFWHPVEGRMSGPQEKCGYPLKAWMCAGDCTNWRAARGCETLCTSDVPLRSQVRVCADAWVAQVRRDRGQVWIARNSDLELDCERYFFTALKKTPTGEFNAKSGCAAYRGWPSCKSLVKQVEKLLDQDQVAEAPARSAH